MSTRTLVEKIWDEHVVADLSGGLDLLHVDRHLVHDLSGPPSLGMLAGRGLAVRNPELTFAMPDHTVSTAVGRTDADTNAGRLLVPALRERTHAEGIRLFDLDDVEQGIVHVVGPELGLTLPGVTVLCGDSHTCTHGGLGALGWGIGSSDLTHVLATQTIVQRRPKQMRVTCSGSLAAGVEPKDLVLHLIGEHGADGASGFAVEYAGSAIASMPVEGRMTLCNLTMEFGAKIGIVAPDEATFDYLAGRRYAPTGAHWDQALAAWRELSSDEDAAFDREIEINASAVSPQITWGTSPAHTMALDGKIPDPGQARDSAARLARSKALEYMGLSAGEQLLGLPVQHVFIGSCANGRLSDLQNAAWVVRGRRVAAGVRAWVVPGSHGVRREAEALGLDRIFTAAGFEWREAGCSMCLAVNDELVPPESDAFRQATATSSAARGRVRARICAVPRRLPLPRLRAASQIPASLPRCPEMERFTSVQGRAIPLPVPDIDTDVITPIKRVMQGGDALVRYAFEPLRYTPDGELKPECPLNQEAYRDAPILLAGANFACGSSRETAVWAVRGLGIRCIIAPSFGDIFFDSCFENGLLPVALPQAELDALADEAPAGEFSVDLERCEVTTPSGRTIAFAVHPLQREALLAGRDSIELTLAREPEISEFQRRDRELRPWVYELTGDT